MVVRVLVVDDSMFYRRRVVQTLNADPQIEVVGEAVNGLEAIKLARELKPDVITMDVNMPVMDGVTAVKRVRAEHPTPILMFSSLTTEGAQATLDALDAGATDFLPKHLENAADDRQKVLDELRTRIHVLASGSVAPPHPALREDTKGADVLLEKPVGWDDLRAARERVSRHEDIKLVVIGSSTGGPVALQRLLMQIPADFCLPILVVQHMPSPFTRTFAQRLNNLCHVQVREARHGDCLEPATVYIAPGGMQTSVAEHSTAIHVEVSSSNSSDIYKPSIDKTLSSAAGIKHGKILAIVLTGMGSDGREGARLLKSSNSTVWVQDEESSVIFGMPKAVIDAGYADQVMSLSEIGESLSSLKL